ncbi:hypothetical protein FB45DRAFT_554849 [Roridomyces roridus]|uniref:Uncharacterized protein n=1 Tax=Roridomyces roridus TaxID=1738132 RepID=A0AAD7BUX3_9AGAR|nr:hypothetical protein FB45DRAFT_554849 [Roridomyces roridus]
MQSSVSTVSDLLSFVIPFAPHLPQDPTITDMSASSTSWSGSRQPPQDDFPSFSFLETHDDSIYDEIMRRGTEELARRNFLNRTLPSHIVQNLDDFGGSYARRVVNCERDIDTLVVNFTFGVLCPLLKWITANDVELCGVDAQCPNPWRDFNLVSVPFSDPPDSYPDPLRGFALEIEMPTTSIAHAQDLQQENDFKYDKQSGAKAMLVNVNAIPTSFLHPLTKLSYSSISPPSTRSRTLVYSSTDGRSGSAKKFALSMAIGPWQSPRDDQRLWHRDILLTHSSSLASRCGNQTQIRSHSSGFFSVFFYREVLHYRHLKSQILFWPRQKQAHPPNFCKENPLLKSATKTVLGAGKLATLILLSFLRRCYCMYKSAQAPL